MIKIDITSDKDFVLFVDPENDIIYNINNKELGDTRDGVLSDWILQLLTKTWININMLYELATIISNKFPTNSIDWHSTFYIVEKKFYLEQTGEILLPNSESGFQTLFNIIEYGRNENNDETNLAIEEIVNKRLANYNLK